MSSGEVKPYTAVLNLSAGQSATVEPDARAVLHTISVVGQAEVHLCESADSCAKFAVLADQALSWFVHIGPGRPLKVSAITNATVVLNGVKFGGT